LIVTTAAVKTGRLDSVAVSAVIFALSGTPYSSRCEELIVFGALVERMMTGLTIPQRRSSI
jgi:hypothetical protein